MFEEDEWPFLEPECLNERCSHEYVTVRESGFDAHHFNCFDEGVCVVHTKRGDLKAVTGRFIRYRHLAYGFEVMLGDAGWAAWDAADPAEREDLWFWAWQVMKEYKFVIDDPGGGDFVSDLEPSEFQEELEGLLRVVDLRVRNQT